MTTAIDAAFLTTLWLVFCRIGSFLLLSPIFALAQVPLRIKIFLLLALAFCLTQFLIVDAVQSAASLQHLIGMMLGEIMIGSAMAFGVFTAFSALLFGGRLLDLQMGFGVAGLIDPSSQEQAPLMGTLLYMTAVLTFFWVDGHLLLIESVAFSFDIRPPGIFYFDFEPAIIISQFGLMFLYGLILFAPAVFTLLLIDVGMAVAARTMPQVNMFIVSLPLKILVGLIVFTLTIPLIKAVLSRLYRDIFIYIERILV